MSFGSIERSWFDEFWGLWHLDRQSNLEDSELRDLWAYEEKPKEETYTILKTHYCHLTPYVYHSTPPQFDEN
jgi:hypothetical protein